MDTFVVKTGSFATTDGGKMDKKGGGGFGV